MTKNFKVYFNGNNEQFLQATGKLFTDGSVYVMWKLHDSESFHDYQEFYRRIFDLVEANEVSITFEENSFFSCTDMRFLLFL